MAINRGARASSHPTPSHFMATLSTPPHAHSTSHTSTHYHKDRSIVLRSFVHLFLVCSFIRPIVHGSFVRPFVRSFDRSFVQIIFFLLLCCRNSDHSIVHRSSIVPIHRSSFVHSPYSSFFQIIFVLLLCCRNSNRSFVRSFDRSSVRS
jgi:hypothetical protein